MERKTSHSSAPRAIPRNNNQQSNTLSYASSLPEESLYRRHGSITTTATSNVMNREEISSLAEPTNPILGTFRHAPQSAISALHKIPSSLARLIKGSANFVSDHIPSTRTLRRGLSSQLNQEDLDEFCKFTLQAGQDLPGTLHELHEDSVCTICMDPFTTEDDGTVTVATEFRYLSCGHLFHRVCIDRWLLGSVSNCQTNRCPVCNVSPEPNASWTHAIYQLMSTQDTTLNIPSSSFSRVGAALLSSSIEEEDAATKGITFILMLSDLADDAASSDDEEDTVFRADYF